MLIPSFMKLIRGIKPEFTDERGDIFSLFDENGKTVIKSALFITCKEGAIRANHYHKEDSHYCYMLSGKMEYTAEPVEGENPERKTVIVNAGDIIYTPSMTKHAMRFLEDSAFLALATKSRRDGKYEDDTVKVKLI